MDFLRIEKKLYLNYNIVMEYKVVETSTVTDDEIEKVLNHWTAKGYAFESVHFVTTESSRRPKMAFVFFTKTRTGEHFATGEAKSMEKSGELNPEGS
jgi:hypothetical protein